ncbi:PAS domain S-box protein [bacterium]|nr:PAS domain S-box protein [bacterium]
MNKNILKTKRIPRLRLLLVVLIVISTGLLVINLIDILSASAGGGTSLQFLWTTGALHLLILLAAWIVWFTLRARERDQRRLRRSEHQHRTIINHAGEAIFLLDHQGRVREWNKAAEKLFGVPRRDVLGRPLQEMPLADGLDLERAMADADRLQRSLTYELPFRPADRPDGMIKLMLSPLPASTSASEDDGAYVVIARDVTSERQLENRISQTEKLAGIGQLAAGIAHQLNTPLGSILLSAQMLSDVDLGEDEAEDVQRIIRQTEQCRQIIKGLLNFARPQSRDRVLVPLGDVVHETVYLMEKNLKVAGVTVALEDDQNPEVLGNRNELDQVFFNLLVNAVDALSEGGEVTITIGDGDPGEIVVVVADDGPGIPPEHRDQIFLPFFTTKSYGKGTGLGLSIVARIMHEHGGRIDYDASARRGARFVLTFPRPGDASGPGRSFDDQSGTATT